MPPEIVSDHELVLICDREKGRLLLRLGSTGPSPKPETRSRRGGRGTSGLTPGIAALGHGGGGGGGGTSLTNGNGVGAAGGDGASGLVIVEF